MKSFNNILYVPSDIDDSMRWGLPLALRLASGKSSTLTVLYLYPEFPEKHKPLQSRFLAFVEDELQRSITTALQMQGISAGEVNYRVVFRELSGTPPAISVIRMVLQERYDLVIKDAEPVEGGRGFKGTDMTLLRKCPSPVWLARKASDAVLPFRLSVAIDPESRDQGEQELSLRILRTAGALADKLQGDLSVVSCWEYEFERLLRYKAWVNISTEELNRNVEDIRRELFIELQRLVKASGIPVGYRIHHMRGRPEDLIPAFTQQERTDLLIMGSVARTGIPGFLIGNTAENIFEKTSCSLLALKPEGFVSPVRQE